MCNSLSGQKLDRAKEVVLGVICNVDYTEIGIIPLGKNIIFENDLKQNTKRKHSIAIEEPR